MQSIPAALVGLAAYPQFVLYILVPSKTRPGKTDKFPVNWQSGKVCNAHDINAWTTFENALAQMHKGVGHGVGFVFTSQDPFFFVDIDGALQADGQWSPLANQLCAAFPGAAIEVSSSGNGLHIIGSGAAHVPADHPCKNAQLGLEFYTQGRFVALTGAQAFGDVRCEVGHVLPWLVQHFFPASSEIVNGTDWTTTPREDWRGPVDDAELIRRAINSKSAASVFGSKASFADLWLGDVDALRKFWPDADSVTGYDQSHADAALASHLAFWTGCNMERMHALMLQSALVRDKWEREDYLVKFTIPRAVSVQKDVCRDKEIEMPSLLVGAPQVENVPVAAQEEKQGGTYLSPSQQRTLFDRCTYILDAHRVLLPTGELVKPDQFKTIFGGYVFIMDEGNEKTTRNAWEAFTDSTVNTCPKVGSSCFRPELVPGAIIAHDGRQYVNTYVPINVPRIKADVSPFLTHLEKLLPNERDRTILLSYMAACVQHKGVKFQWAPLLQGDEGNGKSLFSRCVAAAVGERYTHWPRADQIAAKFNAWLEGRLFIGVEDVYLPDDRGEIIEIIKPMITNDRQPIEAKGVDQRTAWVCCNFILNSNHKDAIKKTRGDRRFAPFYTDQQPEDENWIERCGMGGDYFPNLYDWLKLRNGYAAVAEFLHTYTIPDEFNPATLCPRAPDTSSTEQAIVESRGGVEQEVMEAIGSETSGFMGGWVSSFALAKLLDKLGRSRSLTHRKRETLLSGMGYVKHPGLEGGRVNNPVMPDNGKPVLFVKRGSTQAALEGPAVIAAAYSKAQGVEFGKPPG